MTHPPTGASRDDIAATIRTCLMGTIGSTMDSALIADDTNLFDLGIDSMNMTDLLLQLEQRFSLTFAPEDLSFDLFLRFGNLVSFVESHARHD